MIAVGFGVGSQDPLVLLGGESGGGVGGGVAWGGGSGHLGFFHYAVVSFFCWGRGFCCVRAFFVSVVFWVS